MSKQYLRNHINLIKGKLNTIEDMNEDIINDIQEDVKALLNFKIDKELHKRKIHIKQDTPIKQIKTVKSKAAPAQYYKIDDDIEIEVSQKPKNSNISIIVSTGNFEVDFGMV